MLASPEIAVTPKKVARQGALLMSGFAVSQVLSFARNAVIGHGLSKGDFGIAASITIVLQVIETVSDLGSDRLIVQDRDGDKPEFVATAHTVLVLRALLIAAVLALLAPVSAAFFGVSNAAWAFSLAALAPLIKGFIHLDCRRAQRVLDNRPQMLAEVLPQAVALALTWPAIVVGHDYSAVVWLSLAQALAAVAVTHWVAERPYRLGIDRAVIDRQIAFGLPILISALPLIAVYQGDRVVVGRMAGMEELAGYSAAFLVAMAPGVVAAKVGHSLMLPILSAAIRQRRRLRSVFALMSETMVVAAGIYLAVFLAAGNTILPIFFGAKYAGLGAVLGWLAGMWALRMVQAVPGMALMAAGETKPFIAAGVIRALALPVAALAAVKGHSVATIAAIGTGAEACSLLYIAYRVGRLEHGLGRALVMRTLLLGPIALTGLLVGAAETGGLLCALLSAVAVTLAVAGIGLAVMPSLRAQLRLAVMEAPTKLAH